MPKQQLTDNERMNDRIAPIEKLRQSRVAATKVIDPNRGVGQHLHLKRRRGGALAPGCVPPMRASRRAASRSTNALSASLTTADFSVRPENSCACANNSSSIAMVVLMRVS